MFEGVRGKGLKDYFKSRKGRKLSFASNEPVKIKAGVDIEEIAKSAVEKNIDNIIISSLNGLIKNLKMQLAVKKDTALQSKLEWATEYLEKFTKEVAKIKKSARTRSEEELKRMLKNIEIQSKKVLDSLSDLSFAFTRNSNQEITDKIKIVNEQTLLYEQIVQSYKTKGGKEEYTKIVYKNLKVLYKQAALKIEDSKDELKATPDNYEIKQNITMLEKLADDLVKYAVSPEEYQAMRTQVDKEIAEARKKAQNPEPPVPPTHQDAVIAYEAELNKINALTLEINKCIARVEALTLEKDLTPEMIAEYIALETQISNYTHQIKSSHVTLTGILREAKDKYKIDLSKLTCIEKIKIEKVEYKTEYKAYIEALDRKALEAIKRIKELVLAKAQAKEEDTEKINQDINALFKFNSSIESLINHRIYHHSKLYHKNINDLEKERWDRRREMVKEYGLSQSTEPVVNPDGKTELELYRERLVILSEKWLLALKKAPISRKGELTIDEKVFAAEITTLKDEANDVDKLKILIEVSEQFNQARAQIIKEKRDALNQFRHDVTTRITLIFRSGTIEKNVVKGRDYNEWLTEIEYHELLVLASDPRYKGLVPNTEELIAEYIAEQENKYQAIKKRQQIKIIEKLSSEFALLISNVEPIEMDENFEAKITAIFEQMKVKYKALKDFRYRMDILTNTVTINYTARQYEYSSGSYKYVPIEFSHVIMSVHKHKEYRDKKGLNTTTPPKQDPNLDKGDNEVPEAQINLGEGVPANVSVTNRTIKLATNRRQVIDRAKSLIIKNASPLTVSLIKQGLRIKYNEHLRDQLKSLNAKLSLVNKSNYRSRKDIRFDTDATVQDLAFRTPKENFNINDYKLEIRLVDDEKKRSDLLYTYDLENISEELHGRSK